MKIEIESSDLEKVYDVLVKAGEFHVFGDRMNAALHLARAPRYAPLTSELLAARDRVYELVFSSTKAPEKEARG